MIERISLVDPGPLLTAGIGVTMIIGCEQSSTSGNFLPPAGVEIPTGTAGDVAGEPAGEFISGNLLPPAGMEIPDPAGNVAGEPAGEFISGNLLPPAGMEGGESGPDIEIDMSVPDGTEAGAEAGTEAGAEAGTDG